MTPNYSVNATRHGGHRLTRSEMERPAVAGRVNRSVRQRLVAHKPRNEDA